MSEVDHVKYPDVKQKYRFEQLNRDESKDKQENAVKEVVRPEHNADKPVKKDLSEREEIKEKFRNEPYKRSEVMDKSIDAEAQELNLDPLVIQFMDADLAVDKNDILSKLRPIITNDMIDIMAMSLGVVVNEGDVYDRYNDLRTCLTTMEKFESTRLRS